MGTDQEKQRHCHICLVDSCLGVRQEEEMQEKVKRKREEKQLRPDVPML